MGILPGKRAWVRHYYLEKQYIGTREIFSTFALSNIFGTGVGAHHCKYLKSHPKHKFQSSRKSVKTFISKILESIQLPL